MSVRKRLALAYAGSALVFVVAVRFLSGIGAHAAFIALAALAAAGGLFVYVGNLKCPNCNARAFSRRWLVVPHIPKTCASCDRDFADQ